MYNKSFTVPYPNSVWEAQQLKAQPLKPKLEGEGDSTAAAPQAWKEDKKTPRAAGGAKDEAVEM